MRQHRTVRIPIESGKYRLFYKYLDERYAGTVVLTFRQIEDLLGFPLPAAARTEPDWWTQPVDANYADVWRLARRTATPHLAAGHVVFERIP